MSVAAGMSVAASAQEVRRPPTPEERSGPNAARNDPSYPRRYFEPCQPGQTAGCGHGPEQHDAQVVGPCGVKWKDAYPTSEIATEAPSGARMSSSPS